MKKKRTAPDCHRTPSFPPTHPDRASRGESSMRHAMTTAIALAMAAGSFATCAHDPHETGRKAADGHAGGIASAPSEAVRADFDIVHTRISTAGRVATFHMAVSGKAGATRPAASGKLAGSEVFSYVWPTSIDPWE